MTQDMFFFFLYTSPIEVFPFLNFKILIVESRSPGETNRCIVAWLRGNVKHLTPFEDNAVVGDFVAGLQAGTVPAVSSELVLALMDRNLDSLDCRGCHVRITHAHLELASRQAGQRQTHCVGVQDGVNVRQFQAQNFIGFHPRWRTWGRLKRRQTQG